MTVLFDFGPKVLTIQLQNHQVIPPWMTYQSIPAEPRAISLFDRSTELVSMLENYPASDISKTNDLFTIGNNNRRSQTQKYQTMDVDYDQLEMVLRSFAGPDSEKNKAMATIVGILRRNNVRDSGPGTYASRISLTAPDVANSAECPSPSTEMATMPALEENFSAGLNEDMSISHQSACDDNAAGVSLKDDAAPFIGGNAPYCAQLLPIVSHGYRGGQITETAEIPAISTTMVVTTNSERFEHTDLMQDRTLQDPTSTHRTWRGFLEGLFSFKKQPESGCERYIPPKAIKRNHFSFKKTQFKKKWRKALFPL